MVLNPASAFRVDISVHPVSSEAEDKSLVVYIHLIFLSITSGGSDLKETLCVLCGACVRVQGHWPAQARLMPAVSSVARPGLAIGCEC